MASREKKPRTLQEHWNSVHLTGFYGSLLMATVIFIIFLFFGGSTPVMTQERKILIYAGSYFAFFVLAELIHYLFFYLPNYISYKRMIKDGHEKEILQMINKHGFNKLINKRWFVLKKHAGLDENP